MKLMMLVSKPQAVGLIAQLSLPKGEDHHNNKYKFQNRKRYDLLRNLFFQIFPHAGSKTFGSFKTASGMTYCATRIRKLRGPRQNRRKVSKPQAVGLIAQLAVFFALFADAIRNVFQNRKRYDLLRNCGIRHLRVQDLGRIPVSKPQAVGLIAQPFTPNAAYTWSDGTRVSKPQAVGLFAQQACRISMYVFHD